ncbi:C40 family peptidase [Romboutsia sp. 1001713B170207_170306_H8]|uniref:C40 family peptidase n=1 Tax=Romboutsia sp. 1001713B170207_170306_H8 TaxID=2787112 RepID=UPI0008222DAC|nr:C40 family peptidase [Romboutsia sp. 1001713B170207_170306_H8]SCH19004.1 Probable endopeptidase p60 precursor [uncultured Clostridium sp.]
MSLNNHTLCKVVAGSAVLAAATLVGDITIANAGNNSGVVNVSVLNVRSGAGTNNSIIAKIYKNNTVSILESSNGWYKIKLSNGTVGWSASEYITISGGTSSSSKLGTVTTSVLNVRSGIGTHYSKIGKLSKGTQVNIHDTQDGWHKVNLANGSTGWVHGDYVSVSGESSTPSTGGTQESISNKYGTVNTSSLNVRSGAGTNYSRIGSVKLGQQYNIVGSLNGWYQIDLKNGSTGWVSGQYLNVSDGTVSNESNSNNSSTTISSAAERAVALARQQLGKPYGWGAEGPNSFDCSGLTYYVYKQQGITLPRSSKSQATYGTTVSKSELMPGDLVFFNTNGSGISHVGIYIGDGNMINATKPGDVVKISNINSSYHASRFVTAKRVY